MAWDSPENWPTLLLSGDPIAIFLAILVTFSFPIILHFFLYRSAASPPSAPVFLLLGPSGSGKTSLVTLLQKQSQLPGSASSQIASPTHISSTPQSYRLRLPPSITLGSNRFRSENDTAVILAKKSAGTPYSLLDTPGHGKLRSTVSLAPSTIYLSNLYGVIFLVDASTLDGSNLTDAATYLHSILISLLKRRRESKTLKKSERTRSIPILIAANKQDLFTAVPAGTVRERLEGEIQRITSSRRRGVVEVDKKDDDVGDEDEDYLLGAGSGGGEKFEFKALEDEEGADLRVEVLGGSVRGEGEEEGKRISSWEEWIGMCL